MSDANPTGGAASSEPNGDPSAESAAMATSSSSNADAPIEGSKPFDLMSAPTPPAVPADGEESANESAPLRSSFDLRKALKSAVAVLTKERSFVRDPRPAPEAPSAVPTQAPAEPQIDYEDEAPSQTRPAGLSGHTSAVAIPEVLGFLAQLRKSGTLWIWNDLEQFRIKLLDGNVTFACDESPQRGWLLGEVLISQGALDTKQFEEFLKKPREGGPLGDALVKAGLVDRGALSNAVRFQAQRVFNRAYGLQDAFFCLDADAPRELSPGIRISVTQMLFESARERDESAQRQANATAKTPEG
jgi:hypothetical protein